MLHTFTKHLDITSSDLELLLSSSLEDFLNSHLLQQQLTKLDMDVLRRTCSAAGAVAYSHLPAFYNWLKQELEVERVPDSPEHATKWVIGFLYQRDSISRLIDLHRSVPRPALEMAIPHLVGLFEAIEDIEARLQWQTAMATLCLILAVAARSREANLELSSASLI